MKTKLSKKRAISTVLTTVIILVASVVLGSGVVLYGTSLFQGSTQTESISVTGVKVWVNTDAGGIAGLAWGAAKIRNVGDKVLAVDKIQIRGSDVPFSQWYPDTTVSSSLFQQALNHTGWSGTAGFLENTGSGGCDLSLAVSGQDDICADVGTGPVSLSPGQSAIIYFKLTNGTLSSLDSGVSTGVNIYAGKAGAPQSVTVQGK
ncbi:MAG: hypothetical protein QQN62_01540 [Nitrosopumilus sp.]